MDSVDDDSAPSAARLAASLEALQARQSRVLQLLRDQTAADARLSESAEAAFAQLPEYADKLRRVQATMDALAARTALMRRRAQFTEASQLASESKP